MTFPSYRLFQVLFLLAIVTDAIIGAELGFVFSAIFVIFMIFLPVPEMKFSGGLIWWPFIATSILSLLVGIVSFDLISVVKDAWYFYKPLIYFWMGLGLFRLFSLKRICFIVVGLAILVSALYIMPILMDGDWADMSPGELRDKYGQGSYIFVLGICLIWVHREKRHFSIIDWGMSGILLLAIILSSSRIMLLFLLIFCCISFYPRIFDKKYLQSVIVLVLILSAIPRFDYINTKGSTETFMDKVMFSLSEIRPQFYLLDSDIHTHWRGYETFKGIGHYLDGEDGDIVFGRGFGAHVPIDFPKRTRTSDETVYSLEWLHNGYVTILLKSGMLGLFCFLYLLYRLYHQFPLGRSRVDKLYRFLLILILISTYFLGGYFNKNDVMIPFVLLGYFYMNLATVNKLKASQGLILTNSK